MRHLNSLRAVCVSGGLALAFLAQAPAQAQTVVENSHGVFHVRVCPTPKEGRAGCFAHVVTDKAGNIIVRNGKGATPNFTPSGYGPADLLSAYNLTQTGSTKIIAIVDAYGYSNAEADLAAYRSQFGLPPCTSTNHCFAKYNERGVKGNYPRNNLGWSQETALDLDMASAICPSCKIYLIEANSATYTDLAAAERTAASLGATAISNSYGGGENGSTAYESSYNQPGIAVTVSSGDSGYGAAEFPASSPHVTAVGGTSLTKSAGNWAETAWSGAGSGCSAVYAKPSWQTDTGCSNRMVADVSAVADPYTGVAVYAPVSNSGASGWVVFGGTSVASPIIAGVYALNGGPVNYGANPYSDLGALNDVTSGSNGNCGGSYFCTAGAGYDGPTGLGTPNGSGAF
jgi:subtilase family serine protease